MKVRLRSLAVLALLPTLGLSLICSAQTAPSTTQPDLHAEIVFVIYCRDTPDPVAELRKELANQPANAKWNEIPKSDPGDGLFATIIATEKYPPPAEDSLKYFGRGITNEDAQQLQSIKTCLGLIFKRDWSTNYEFLHAAEKVVYATAIRTNGLIWDDSTRLMYAPATYKELILDHWSDDLPSLRRDLAIHEYADGDHMRAVTLGMEKFGLPNLAVNDFARSTAPSLGALMVLCAQTMIENRPSHLGDDVLVNLDLLKQNDVREWITSTLLEGATKKDQLHLKPSAHEQGDAETPLYEISFDQEKANTLYERQDLLVSRVFGKHDEAMGVKHDAEMLALVAKSREQLQALKPHFQAGLLPGERLVIESPFYQDEKTEWMWVEVTKWDGDVISGVLQNDPDIVKSLKAGAPVTVKASEAFDYVFTHSDRSSEGNETSKLMRKRGY